MVKDAISRDSIPIEANPISAGFVSVLRSGREQFNSRFAEARRAYRELDGEAFLQFLRSSVDPMIRAVEKVRANCLPEVIMAAYDVGLELAGQRLVGPGARYPLIEIGWRGVLSSVPALVAAEPDRLIRAVSNALCYLVTTPGARPEQWIDELGKLGPKCADVNALLRLGQVLGWRAGLAHFRSGAIVAADGLPQPLALAAVGAPGSGDWEPIRKGLLADPWFDPAGSSAARHKALRMVGKAGAFRGFNGVFTQPPLVAVSREGFSVSSGAEYWLLTADFFGATFHRATAAEHQSALQQQQLQPGLKISDSRLVWKNETCELTDLGRITSAAANETTVAITTDLTHAVVLVALNGQ